MTIIADTQEADQEQALAEWGRRVLTEFEACEASESFEHEAAFNRQCDALAQVPLALPSWADSWTRAEVSSTIADDLSAAVEAVSDVTSVGGMAGKITELFQIRLADGHVTRFGPCPELSGESGTLLLASDEAPDASAVLMTLIRHTAIEELEQMVPGEAEGPVVPCRVDGCRYRTHQIQAFDTAPLFHTGHRRHLGGLFEVAATLEPELDANGEELSATGQWKVHCMLSDTADMSPAQANAYARAISAVSRWARRKNEERIPA